MSQNGEPQQTANGWLMACVDVPELPLQILLREHSDWKNGPAAVVEEDSPEARLIYLNRNARKRGLRTGHRYGAARSLVPGLRAAPISDKRIEEEVEELTTALQTFSPRVEPEAGRPGVFFIDPKGLDRIYGDGTSWAKSVHQYLSARSFFNSIAIAHGRFQSFAIARSSRGALVMKTPEQTQARVERVRLEELGVSPKLRDGLEMLGIRTAGDLIGLPSGELHSRFGKEASLLQGLLSDDPQQPMQPSSFADPVVVKVEINPPDANHERLLFAIKGALHELLREVTDRAHTLAALRIELHQECAQRVTERIEPAETTRNSTTLIDLVRLRLANVKLEAGVTEVVLEAEMAKLTGDQLAFFQGSKRDLKAGSRALARIRAAFGERSVTRAKLRDAHLPEASFEWERTREVPKRSTKPKLKTNITPIKPSKRPLIRRFIHPPEAFSRHANKENLINPRNTERVLKLFGPYRVNGGWWIREIERDYYYGETETGDLLWLFYDHPRKRWYLHGVVD